MARNVHINPSAESRRELDELAEELAQRLGIEEEEVQMDYRARQVCVPDFAVKAMLAAMRAVNP